MERRDADQASITSDSGTIDSLDERLRAASLNALHNRKPQFPAASGYVEPPQTNATDIRPYLKTPEDEERALTSGFSNTASTSRLSLSADPPTSGFFEQSTSDAEMDRKLRQNKPRLLLMGQRR